MLELYTHQREGVAFLAQRNAAMLADEMGLGKTREALCAAKQLFDERKIDRVLVLAPAAVRYSWLEEIKKLSEQKLVVIWCSYNVKEQIVSAQKLAELVRQLPLLVVSYALLPQVKHVKALTKWCASGSTLLVCDESSFLKNRAAKQTVSSIEIAHSCAYRWLLTGTPVANSPLDLWSQSVVMSAGLNGRVGRIGGPLAQFKSFYQFRARYAVLKLTNFGAARSFQQVVAYQNLSELTKRFAPYVLRREKKDCLDLPDKTYVVREVELNKKTWAIYQELRREALLALPDEDVKPEPNAAVRLLRLCQLTSGHVGTGQQMTDAEEFLQQEGGRVGILIGASTDVSSEKLDFIVDALLDGELRDEQAVIVWTRWRRERERLVKMLPSNKLTVLQIFGGQSQKQREQDIAAFQSGNNPKRVLMAQVHAGGFGLNLTAASTAVYLSNTFSYTDRIQSEDRCHRIGQKRSVTYVDVVAVGPKGQRTVDHHVLECLRAKKDIAQMTCSAWRRVLSDE
jgi:SNF2 family DNA or RNA helicase